MSNHKDYISKEEFLKQNRSIQIILTSWWQPKQGDLYQTNFINFSNPIRTIKEVHYYNRITSYNIGYSSDSKGDCIPLLSESQLRQFIEERTKCKIATQYENNKCKISLYNELKNEYIKTFDDLPIDLLQAYWKVTLKIIKDSETYRCWESDK